MTSRGSISRRAEAVRPSATLAITTKANQMRAAGEPVIGFGAGEPNFPTPEHIVAAAISEAAMPRSHRYSATPGQPALREAVAIKTERDSGFAAKPGNVIITNGGKQAVYLTCQVLLDPGDEVLLPAPYWVTYPEAVGLAGGVTVPIHTDESTNFSVTVDQLEAATNERTKMLIFVSPSNPTGAVYSPDQVQTIAQWAADRGIWVMTDEIYEHLTYGSAQFASVPVMAPDAADRTVIVNGVSKTYAMTGWRVGWMIAPDEVASGASRIQSHLSSNVNNVAQAAALAAVTGPLDASLDMRQAFDRRRQVMVRMLRSIDGVSCQEPQGAFYAFPNISGLLDRSFNGRTATTTLDLAALILEETKVAIVPGEAFGAPGYARLSFALSDEDLVEGIQRIADFVAVDD